jgi:sodium transport system ATP-binding protein
MIETNQLSKVFYDPKRGHVRAVDGLTIRCEPGKIFGLLGANGAGKTTTLRILATILKPTSGSAVIAGHDIIREPDQVRSSIGFLSTATALYARLTGREFIEYFGRLHGISEERLQERVEELLTRLGIREFADRPCDKLSTGMKQKISIARTIIHDPPVVIFDEPTVGLDVMTSRTILQFIRECRQNQKTVIFSTHVMREAEKLCDRIAIIHQGKIMAQGSLTELQDSTGIMDLEDIFIHYVGESV